MRVQGGTNGLLTALWTGRVELDGRERDEIGFHPYTESEYRAKAARTARARKLKAKKLARTRPV